MRCPGQDMAYWTGELAFEVPCPKCDHKVEFFKDETSSRCPKCGHRLRNPRIPFDCAKWCSFAEECLGFVPERPSAPDPGDGALASRLIRALKDQYGANQPRIDHALAAFLFARELMAREGGDPRLVLAASMLLATATDKTEGPPKAKQILQKLDLDQDAIDCVYHIVEGYRNRKNLDTIEFRIACDAHTLARLTALRADGDPAELAGIVERDLQTKSGKDRGRQLLGSSGRDNAGQP